VRTQHLREKDDLKLSLCLTKDIHAYKTLSQFPTDLHTIRITSSDTYFKALVRNQCPSVVSGCKSEFYIDIYVGGTSKRKKNHLRMKREGRERKITLDTPLHRLYLDNPH